MKAKTWRHASPAPRGYTPRTAWGPLLARASAQLPPNLKEALRLAALANGDSMSEVIRRALERETRSLIRRLK